MHVVFCSHLCARTREVGVSSRNLVSRTFPHLFLSTLTPMKNINISDFQFYQIQNNLDIWHYVWFTLLVQAFYAQKGPFTKQIATEGFSTVLGQLMSPL